jgi:hypothetical protein
MPNFTVKELESVKNQLDAGTPLGLCLTDELKEKIKKTTPRGFMVFRKELIDQYPDILELIKKNRPVQPEPSDYMGRIKAAKSLRVLDKIITELNSHLAKAHDKKAKLSKQ